MNLENLVCSLESAKRLKELGVPQKSFFYWHDGTTIIYPDYQPNMNRSISAFTAGELGEMLPPSVDGRWLTMSKYSGSENMVYLIGYCTANIKEIWHVQRELTEAEARAKALIYLLENNLMEV